MARARLASLLGYAAGGLLTLTALFHLSGLGYVQRLAAAAGGDLKAIVPALWLAFSVSLLVAALVAVVVAHRPEPTYWLVLLSVALAPAAAVILQVIFVGFGLPSAALLLDTVVLIAASVALRQLSPRPAA